jgi:hypothetical protein
MRAIAILLTVLLCTGVQAMQAQVDYYGRLGATFATPLVRDVIIDEVEVRQSLAPTVVLGASLPIAPLYRAGLEATVTSSGYHSREAGSSFGLGTLRTGSVILGLDGPIAQGIRWRAGVGVIGYWPTQDRGIFLRGGTTRFLAGAGADYRRAVMSQWDLMVSLRYDFHRFTTDELKARGFSQSQGVQRVSLTLGLARGGR